MYTKYFGLVTKPFELVPNPLFLFNSHSHKKALNYLKYGLQERAGFIMLVGEVGSGKTTIIRDIISHLSDDIILSQVFNTSANVRQILAMINEDFGLTVDGKDKVALLRDLNDHLIALHTSGKRAVIIIDEAQNLSPAVLEEVRLLSNLEAKNAKLVQIVLVGQPELQTIITQPELRQLRQRISVHCQLEPLTREETEEYVFHRLATAGNRHALVWHDGVFDALYEYSEGWPRMINIFCDFALLCVYVENTRTLTLDMMTEIIGDIAWDTPIAAGNKHQQCSLLQKTAGTRPNTAIAPEDGGTAILENGNSCKTIDVNFLQEMLETQVASVHKLDNSLHDIAVQLKQLNKTISSIALKQSNSAVLHGKTR